MSKNRTIPYSEFRRAGMRLLLEHTALPGILTGALFASLLVVLTVDIMIWFAVIAAEIFGMVGELTRAGSAWMTIPFSTGQGLDALLLLPVRMLPQLWKMDLFLSLVFCIAALPLKKSFALQQERARGWKGGSLWLRWFPGIVFFVSFFVLFLLLALPKFTADSSPALLIPLPASQSYLLALLAITIYSALTSLVLYFVWEWGIFRGLLLFHRTMVWGPDKIRIQDIHSLFAEKEETL